MVGQSKETRVLFMSDVTGVSDSFVPLIELSFVSSSPTGLSGFLSIEQL